MTGFTGAVSVAYSTGSITGYYTVWGCCDTGLAVSWTLFWNKWMNEWINKFIIIKMGKKM